ncbi:hypothetical protein HPSMNH_1415 [Glaesserella parasuis MN-H]|nr:hypothetical protein HPSMNH_1415 [Glaesserella parasuis MN-H]EQA14244.1 hypothetical protein HPSH465_0231 [Glaesserella parasuis H465]
MGVNMDLLAYFIIGSFILAILAHAFMGFAFFIALIVAAINFIFYPFIILVSLFIPKARTELKKTSEQYSNTVEQEIAAIKRISNNVKI